MVFTSKAIYQFFKGAWYETHCNYGQVRTCPSDRSIVFLALRAEGKTREKADDILDRIEGKR